MEGGAEDDGKWCVSVKSQFGEEGLFKGALYYIALRVGERGDWETVSDCGFVVDLVEKVYLATWERYRRYCRC